jgi:3-methyladenine DNA glycosylase AlkD
LTTVENIVDEIRQSANPKALDGMTRFGIQTSKAFGVSIPELRKIARRTGTNHDLALQLWRTGIHEARILASMIDDPAKVTGDQMEKWAADFDSWDVVDGCCGNLFDKTKIALSKAQEWSGRREEYVKRAGFVLMAEMAVHDKKAPNSTFLEFLPLIEKEALDQRNFVKKAVNWPLRQIGKRNTALNQAALRACKRIQRLDSKSARWIASDALRELTSVQVQKKLRGATKAALRK